MTALLRNRYLCTFRQGEARAKAGSSEGPALLAGYRWGDHTSSWSGVVYSDSRQGVVRPVIGVVLCPPYR